MDSEIDEEIDKKTKDYGNYEVKNIRKRRNHKIISGEKHYRNQKGSKYDQR
jgi:hypothetical protein